MKRILAILLFIPGLACAQDNASVPVTDTGMVGQFGSACTYPNAALSAKAEGRTEVTYNVTSGGEILDVTILSRNGNSDLDAATIQCLSRWHVTFQTASSGTGVGPQRGEVIWKIPSGIFRAEPPDCARWYPSIATRIPAGDTTIMLRLSVTPDGRVTDVAVEQSSGFPDLDAMQVACAKFRHYAQITKDGESTKTIRRVKIIFRSGIPIPNTAPPRGSSAILGL
jgi:TonB family protein